MDTFIIFFLCVKAAQYHSIFLPSLFSVKYRIVIHSIRERRVLKIENKEEEEEDYIY